MEQGALITDRAGEFAAALPDGGVLLALDLGTQTIGTALCDAGWRFASADKTLPRGKFGRDREVVAAHVAEVQAALLVGQAEAVALERAQELHDRALADLQLVVPRELLGEEPLAG